MVMATINSGGKALATTELQMGLVEVKDVEIANEVERTGSLKLRKR
jgi:hypothetical protein